MARREPAPAPDERDPTGGSLRDAGPRGGEAGAAGSAAAGGAGGTGGTGGAGGTSDRTGTVNVGSSAAGHDAGRDAGADPDSTAPDGGACEGQSCPQCSADADCERIGMSGARCVDSMCWAPMTECETDQECETRGPEYVGGRCLAMQCRPNPRWRCEVPPTPPPGGKKLLTVLLRDSLSLSPVPGVRIVACQKLDLECVQPIAEATTAMDGNLMIEVPGNFAGYLQQTEARDYAPAMYFLPATFPEDGVLQPFPLLGSGAIIDALAAGLGAERDPTRGHLMLIAEDCFGMALPGVTFTSPQADDKTVQFYVRDLLPSTMAKETAEIGNGGYLNFPAGTALISVSQVSTELALATVSVVVRAGFISVSYIRPQAR